MRTLTLRVRVQSPNAVSEARVQSPIPMQWSGFLLVNQHVVLVIAAPPHLSLALSYNVVCVAFILSATAKSIRPLSVILSYWLLTPRSRSNSTCVFACSALFTFLNSCKIVTLLALALSHDWVS